MLRFYVPAIRNLIDRGLVRDVGRTDEERRANDWRPEPLISHVEPTEAGGYVLQLLRCNGTYDELKREFMRHRPNKYGTYYEVTE